MLQEKSLLGKIEAWNIEVLEVLFSNCHHFPSNQDMALVGGIRVLFYQRYLSTYPVDNSSYTIYQLVKCINAQKPTSIGQFYN